MKKTYRYLMLALAGTAILSGCGKKDDDKHADETEASVSTEAAGRERIQGQKLRRKQKAVRCSRSLRLITL
ncbi:MAG: hypothetical protein ACLTSZ_03020 [Lachnospiraceae bacterium]